MEFCWKSPPVFFTTKKITGVLFWRKMFARIPPKPAVCFFSNFERGIFPYEITSICGVNTLGLIHPGCWLTTRIITFNLRAEKRRQDPIYTSLNWRQKVLKMFKPHRFSPAKMLLWGSVPHTTAETRHPPSSRGFAGPCPCFQAISPQGLRSFDTNFLFSPPDINSYLEDHPS